MDVGALQLFQKFDRAVHGFWCCSVAFIAALCEALGFVGVVLQIVVVEFWVQGDNISWHVIVG